MQNPHSQKKRTGLSAQSVFFIGTCPFDDQQFVKVGQFRAAHGIKGAVWVYSYTDPMPNILNYNPWYVRLDNSILAQLKSVKGKKQGSGLVAELEGVNSRNDIELFAGLDIYVAANSIPKLTNNEFYWSDLKGLYVYTDPSLGEIKLLGVIDHLFETGANDVMVVKSCDGSVDVEERLIPWHDSVVLSVNLEAQKVVVLWGEDY